MGATWTETVEPLQRLLETLPDMATATDPDQQIRSVLKPVVERALSAASTRQDPIPADPTTCPNCGTPVEAERSPYCSPACRETASFVRQFRASMESGMAFDLERQVALGQALWSLQGGGYPRRQAMVPARVIAKVIEREGGVCSICGAPATEIDHTGSG